MTLLSDLYSTASGTTASNLGAGEGIYSTKVGVDLRFKSLIGGDNITLSSDSNEITISGSAGDGGLSNVVEDTSPQLGGDLDLNNHNISYESILTISGTYEGEIITSTVDDATTVFGNVLYQAADFHFERANANSDTTSPVFVMALEAGNGSKKAMFKGQVCDTSWNWSAGLVYLSTTSGTMTQTTVSGSGDCLQILGFALSSDTVYFNPSYVIAEIE